MSEKYITKDSGKRVTYPSNMTRDLQDGKPDFHLITPTLMPYNKQLLTRWAGLMTRGKEKYGSRNWEQARSNEELERFKSSAARHFQQWITGEVDEDHCVATWFNMQAAEYVKWRLDNEGEQNNEARARRDN